MCFYFSSTNRKTLFVILFCILNGAGIVVSAQEIPQQGSFVTRATQDRKLSAASYVPPSKKGELSCYQANSTPAKEICTYFPINELAGSLKARILRAYFGSRQPSNPDEAYISVSQDQLEFAFTDQALMQEIKAIIPRLDTLDTYVVRRKVNIVVEILQLMEGADDSAGFLIGAQYTGNSRDRKSVV